MSLDRIGVLAVIALAVGCAEVPTEDREPGSGSGKADGVTDPCSFTLTSTPDVWSRVCPDRDHYDPGELVTFTYEIENRGTEDRHFDVFVNCGFEFGFLVRGAGAVFAYPGDRGFCPQETRDVVVPAGDRYEASATWDQRIFFGPSDTSAVPGPQVPDGQYSVRARLGAYEDLYVDQGASARNLFTIGSGGGVSETCAPGPTPSAVAFAPPVHYPIGDWPWAVKAGHLNDDGAIDLAVSAFRSDTVTILHGVGDGSFIAPDVHGTQQHPSSLAIAESRVEPSLDGDSYPEIVVGFEADSDVTVLHGAADGSFPSSWNHGTAEWPHGVALADVNGDGRPDILSANVGEHEFDGTVSVLINAGGGPFNAALNFPAGRSPHSLAPGDFDGDGDIDLAVADQNGGLSVLLGDGQGGFSDPIDWAYGLNGMAIVTADFNCDGRLDLAAANGGYHDVVVLLGNGDGTFRGVMTTPPAPKNTFGVAVGDFDGDTWPDLVAVGQLPVNRGVTIFRGKGDGTFETALELQAHTVSEQVEVADLNGDGKPDLAVTNRGSGDLSVLINTSAP